VVKVWKFVNIVLLISSLLVFIAIILIAKVDFDIFVFALDEDSWSRYLNIINHYIRLLIVISSHMVNSSKLQLNCVKNTAQEVIDKKANLWITQVDNASLFDISKGHLRSIREIHPNKRMTLLPITVKTYLIKNQALNCKPRNQPNFYQLVESSKDVGIVSG